MNVENMQKLRARIAECADYEGPFVGDYQSLPPVDEHYEDAPLLFHMRETTFYCGTPACLQGHTEALAWEEFWEEEAMPPRMWLGLSGAAADNLFVPDGFNLPDEPGYRERFGRDAALDTLDHAIATGEVAWPHQRSTT